MRRARREGLLHVVVPDVGREDECWWWNVEKRRNMSGMPLGGVEMRVQILEVWKRVGMVRRWRKREKASW